jgi:guanylate kinase
MSQPHGKIIILIGPSGVGKSSFIEQVLKEVATICDLITYTTRKPRAGEKEGDPYHFVSLERFEELKKKNFFVETAKVHDNFYGTPWDQIRDAWAKNKIIIMDVDVQGARVFKKTFPQALTIFLAPPNMDALRKRIEARGAIPNIDVRLKTAANEMQAAHEFRHHLVNDDFATAYAQFRILIENLLKNQ